MVEIIPKINKKKRGGERIFNLVRRRRNIN
jgi:hypothetical protein